MRSLAIYGDSFATELPDPAHSPALGDTWASHLRLNRPEGSVQNHAVSASSLQYSYHEWLGTHDQYDRTVFVVTNWHRITLPVIWWDHQHCRHVTRHICGAQDAQRIRQAASRIEDPDILAFIEQYYVRMAYTDLSDQYEQDRIQAVVRSIQVLRPDTVIIPAFEHTQDMLGYTWCLNDISKQECLAGQQPWQVGQEDPRAAHLTPRSHEFVARHVEARLQGQWLEWDPAATPRDLCYDDLLARGGLRASGQWRDHLGQPFLPGSYSTPT